jgi:hypothetical protein
LVDPTGTSAIFSTPIYQNLHNIRKGCAGTLIAGEKMATEADTEKPIKTCPFCGSADLKKFDELADGIGAEEMTEKELADYKAGKWGTMICSDCGLAIDYQIE